MNGTTPRKTDPIRYPVRSPKSILMRPVSVSWSQCVQQSEVFTQRDIRAYGAQGIWHMMTEEFCRGVFPEIPTDRIWYSADKEFPCFYYNQDTHALCKLDVLGFLQGTDGAEEGGWESIQVCERAAQAHDFNAMFSVLPDELKLGYFSALQHDPNIRPDETYRLFRETYPTGTYGISGLSSSSFQRLFLAAEKADLAQDLADLPDKIPVFRANCNVVEGNPAKAWYLDSRAALAYMMDHAYANAEYVVGEVDKADILCAFRGSPQEQIIVDSQNVRIEETYPMINFSEVGPMLEAVSGLFQEYAELALSLTFTGDNASFYRDKAFRCLILALVLGAFLSLPAASLHALCQAAIFKDTREHDLCSDEPLAEVITYYREVMPNPDPLVEVLCMRYNENCSLNIWPTPLDEETRELCNVLLDASCLAGLNPPGYPQIEDLEALDHDMAIRLALFARDLQLETY